MVSSISAKQLHWDELVVETRAVSFKLFVAGSGSKPVLYLHGEAASAPDEVAAGLAADHRLVCPVHPGFADAPRPDWVENVRDVADLYADLVKEMLDPDPFTIVGVSLGGWIAAELALLFPERTSRLVLVGAAGLSVPDASPADHWFATEEERRRILFADPALTPRVTPEEYIANDETTARYAWNPRFADPTLAYRLRRLTMPALVIWGAEDRLLSTAHGEAWQKRLSIARLEIIAGAGHFPNYERTSQTLGVIRSFLGEAEQTRRGRDKAL
jgi:pimeloyl-ACP methyl ester carboxylesterase